MAQSETKSKPAGASKESGGLFSKVRGALRESFLQKPTYFEGEITQQTIRMASYRASVPKYFGFLGFLLLFLAVWGLAFVALNTPEEGVAELPPEQAQLLDNLDIMSWGGIIAAALLFSRAALSALAYQQWQFIITDKRIIITTPDPDRGLFADTIYLKNDTIKVLDTNFSKDPLWVVLQILTGARDVMLSTGAYAFMEKGAKVKDGIRFPDVTSQDVKLLEKLVFGGKK